MIAGERKSHYCCAQPFSHNLILIFENTRMFFSFFDTVNHMTQWQRHYAWRGRTWFKSSLSDEASSVLPVVRSSTSHSCCVDKRVRIVWLPVHYRFHKRWTMKWPHEGELITAFLSPCAPFRFSFKLDFHWEKNVSWLSIMWHCQSLKLCVRHSKTIDTRQWVGSEDLWKKVSESTLG